MTNLYRIPKSIFEKLEPPKPPEPIGIKYKKVLHPLIDKLERRRYSNAVLSKRRLN